ncbi:hypothetical protein CRU92_03900 [Arcobacter sp. FW59]|nr:hypothetical protein CRU92_03900 [Arcobacter sp. FW59]
MLFYFIIFYVVLVFILDKYLQSDISVYLSSFLIALIISYFLKKRIGSFEEKIEKNENKVLSRYLILIPEFWLLFVGLMIIYLIG